MLAQDLINQINIDSNDLPDSDAETIQYINYGLDALSFYLSNVNDPEMLVKQNFTDGDFVPSNYIKLVPENGYPLSIIGDRFYTSVSGATVIGVKYSASKPHISAVTDTIPFKDIYSGALCFLVSKMIKGKSNFPKVITQNADENLQTVLDLIKAAKAVS